VNTEHFFFEKEKVSMLSGKQFRLVRATLAIGDTDGKRKAVTLPLGTVIKVVSGPSNDDGMVDVLCEGRVLEMFAVDVDVRGTEIREQSAGA